MEYRQFGQTDLRVSVTGFGAWAIGGNAKVGDTAIGWGTADDTVSIEAIRAALDAGINFFDTADFYGLGHSELLLGQALLHTDAVIATKVGHRAIDGKIVLDYSKKYILEACDASLQRLKRDQIDYYQLHSARIEHLENGECIEAMEELQAFGKIRYWGLSLNTFHPDKEGQWMIKHGKGQGLQLVFNLINQRAHELMKEAAKAGYGVIARMPLQFGLLTGKFSRKQEFGPDDHRSFRLTPEVLDRSLAILEEHVWPLAKKNNLSPAALAMSFIVSHKEVSTVIPGIRTAAHVEQNVSFKTLGNQSMDELHALSLNEWKEVLETMERLG